MCIVSYLFYNYLWIIITQANKTQETVTQATVTQETGTQGTETQETETQGTGTQGTVTQARGRWSNDADDGTPCNLHDCHHRWCCLQRLAPCPWHQVVRLQ